jgi:hypothetical protein
LARKVYLVYDFEEFCGAYSSFALARKAVSEHLSHVKKYALQQAKKLEFGDLDFEVTESSGESHWSYSFLAKTKSNGLDLHCRRPTIYECPMDEYDSMTKRLMDRKK